MAKLIDLTGKTFNYLTVIQREENKGRRPQWLCECVCGNRIIVSGESLRTGTRKSCGCKRKRDLSNQRFGRLIALYPTEKRTKDRSVIWHCKCDCGSECDIPSDALLSGNSKSCGCLNNETRVQLGKNNKKNLAGQRFGKLIVIKDSGLRKNNCVLWECKCDCGNTVLIKSSSLLSGTQSCGCVKSKGEEKVAKILSSNNIQFETQKTFETCRFPDTNKLARFDFYLPDYNLLIEYDGIQHFEAKEGGWNNEENLLKTQEHDKIKNKWCQDNNIPLIRIPYTKLKNLSIKDILIG